MIDPDGNIQPLIVQLQSAKIGNFVWLDSDADGIQDAGESGINSVIVELYDANGVKIASTVTGDDFGTAAVENGYYQFAGLRAGDYQVRFIAPTFEFTVKDSTAAGATDSNDSDVNALNGFSDLIRLADRESNQTIDAGLVQRPNAQISGFVYEDVGNDGVRNSEPAIAGVRITLTGTNDLGQSVTATAITNAAGFYAFTGLRPGTYAVTQAQPDGFLDGKDTIGTAGGTAANDTLSGIVLVAGANSQNNNFGEIRPAVVSGFVYEDSNNDGLRAGDTPISGATVTLTGTNDLGQTVTRTATTGTDGSYSFADLRPGSYTVRETQPAGFADGRDTAGSNGAAVTANDEIRVTVGQGQSSTENNFGEVRLGSIAGNVFFDANNDGLRTGDSGIAGVSVTLTGTNDLGAAVNTTVQTDATGAYVFANLRPGTYAVAESQPAAFLDGRDTAGTIGGVSTGSAAANDTITGIVLRSGQASIENNFGEIRPAVVSGFVFEDSNNDGLRTGDTPISGATVTLTGTNDLGQTVTRTATTGADGSYSFADLRPGTYTVRETQPAGFADGKDSAGSNGATVTANDEIRVTVGQGQSSTENNFGEVRLGSIAGNVFFDANNDGLRTGDSGIAGVSVTLTGTNDL
ncbi:MAG: SdrD B-like domain-containing protein, partial [Aquabacterium sp.]|nr:SdrD B-like domain-containing protein [Aquabacterium sp.]